MGVTPLISIPFHRGIMGSAGIKRLSGPYPSLRPCERARATRVTTKLHWEGLSGCFVAIYNQPGLSRWSEYTVHTVGTTFNDSARCEADQEWLSALVPSQGNVRISGYDPLSSEGANIAVPGKSRLRHWYGLVGKYRVDADLNLLLQPASQRDIVGVDSDLVICYLALYEKGVSGAAW